MNQAISESTAAERTESRLVRVRIKSGINELEYEGPSHLFGDGLKEEIEGFFGLMREANQSVKGVKHREEGEGAPNAPLSQATIKTIAARLKCTTGGELVLAACARLTIFDGKDILTRKEIFEVMKSATGYFMTSYGKNLSNYLTALVGNAKLREQSSDAYTLEASALEELRGKLS